MSTEIKSMTIWEAAYKVLKQEGRPLHLRAIRLLIGDGNLFEFGARDPVKVLGVELDRHSAGVEVSKSTTPQLFYRASPATYGLLEWLSKDELEDLQTDATIAESAEQASLDSTLFLERELHLWLYKNLRENGLKVFGFGHLTEYNPGSATDNVAKYQTGVVGEMDMLLRTADNDLVVLELKRRATDQTVGQMCRYFGYAKEHLSAPGKKVHGLILAQEVSTSLHYALKAVSPDIRVRQLHFEVTLGDPLP
jgi:hypothetical protein